MIWRTPTLSSIILLAATISLSFLANAQTREADSPDLNVHLVPVSHNQSAVVSLGNILLNVQNSTNIVQIADLYETGAANLEFSDGRLTRLFRPGCATNYVGDATLFPEVTKTNIVGVLKHWRKLDQSDRSAWKYWEKSGRLQLFYANPNATGTLFAEIAIILFAFGLLFVNSWWARSLCFLGTVLSVGCIFATGSRGAFVAFILGVVMLLARLLAFNRACKLRIWAASAISVAIILLAALSMSNSITSRFGSNLFALDSGNVQRLQAWSKAPAMLAAAPKGWGAQCGIAYEEYFQPAFDSDPLIYLANTHLEWMVAHGWVFSVFYVFLHFLLFALLVRRTCTGNRASALTLSLFITFFVACFFSTVGIYASLWILPVLSLALTACAIYPYSRSLFKEICIFSIISLVLSSSFIGLIVNVGKHQLAHMPVPIHRTGNTTFIGSGNRLVYLVPDAWVLARFFYGSMGADIRNWCMKHPGEGTLAVVNTLDDLPQQVDRVVLVGLSAFEYVRRYRKGKALNNLCVSKSLAFIAPPFSSEALPSSFYKTMNAEIFTGEFLAQLTGDIDNINPYVSVIPNTELYIPDWVDIAFSEGK